MLEKNVSNDIFNNPEMFQGEKLGQAYPFH